MKKTILMILALLMLLTSSAALAADMGVQVIGGDMGAAQTVTLDDLKIDEAAEIEGFGTLTLTDCKFVDLLHQYKKGKTTVEGNWNRFSSGVEADYLIVQANILNTTSAEMDYLKNCEVKVVFDDNAEFAGWCYQYNWDNGTKNREWDELNGIQNKEFVIDVADQFAIGGWYEGHFCFGCTLPNAVVNGKQPLRVEIKLGGNEITHHIRK